MRSDFHGSEGRMRDEKRICRRCLAKELPDASYYKNMYEYIRNLDKDIKTAEEDYEQRLAVCKDCDSLLNGMCRICGCFVELRAAVRRNYCPAIVRRW